MRPACSTRGKCQNFATGPPEQVPSLKPYETWAEFGANLRGTPEEQAELLALFKGHRQLAGVWPQRCTRSGPGH